MFTNHDRNLKAKLFHYIKKLSIYFFITFIFLEIALAIYVNVTDLKMELPTYTFENTQSFWFDANKDFGTIHLPNHKYRQKKTCYDVLYQSNSYGFRDVERTKESVNKRVLSIGDSFIEGYGVNTENRLSNLLESNTEIPHLNFGVSGNFGPVQYYLLYKSLAVNFSHDAILIGLLPSNDFIDDDYEFCKKVGSNRYKPFLDGNYPNYDIVYYLDSLHKSKASPKKQNIVKKVLKNFTYTYNMTLYLRSKSLLLTTPDSAIISQDNIPSYFNFTAAQLDRVKYVLEQMKTLAKDKKVMLVSIPNYNEVKLYKESQNNPLGKELTSFCKKKNIDYLDLLPLQSELNENELQNHFLSCDGHWSKKGNEFAMEQILQHFNFYK